MAHLQATKAFVQRLAAEGRLVTKAAGGLKSTAFDYRRFNQYGLFEDDVLKETPIVKEALRRLPRDVYQERNFRFTRAIDISAKQRCLDQKDWTKAEEDIPYLRTYVSEVEKEEQEKDDWENGNIKI